MFVSESETVPDFTLVVSIMVTSIFLELGSTIDKIESLGPELTIQEVVANEKDLDGVFRTIFKARTFHVCWQVLHRMFLIQLPL